MNLWRSRIGCRACRGWKISLNTISNVRPWPASRRKPPATRRCETSCSGSPSRSRRSPSISNSTKTDADPFCSNAPPGWNARQRAKLERFGTLAGPLIFCLSRFLRPSCQRAGLTERARAVRAPAALNRAIVKSLGILTVGRRYTGKPRRRVSATLSAGIQLAAVLLSMSWRPRCCFTIGKKNSRPIVANITRRTRGSHFYCLRVLAFGRSLPLPSPDNGRGVKGARSRSPLPAPPIPLPAADFGLAQTGAIWY